MEYGVYQGCHNTFVICDWQNICLSKLAKDLSSKHHTDGFIALKKIDNECDFEMFFYNQDGSRAPMCGNGIRSMILFAYEHHYVQANKLIKIKTLSGIREAIITNTAPFIVKVNLGKPSFNPLDLAIDTENEFIEKELSIDKDNKIRLSAIFLCTDHCVVIANDIKEVEKYGQKICHHSFFKRGVNVNFVKILDRDNIFVHTYERGVGWTLACGTGASSSFAIAQRLGLVNNQVIAHFLDGEIKVTINNNDEIMMEGPAERENYFNA